MSELIDKPVSNETTTKSAEIVISARSKRYPVAYKLRIIEEADRCLGPGEIGALLRREGLHFSTLADFRKQKLRGSLDGVRSAKPIKSALDRAAVKALAAKDRELRQVRRELECMTALVELQKKVAEIVGLTLARSE